MTEKIKTSADNPSEIHSAYTHTEYNESTELSLGGNLKAQ